ncbi:MAG: GNAT family N-acetyltransferase [Gammaproteobacteria bacterium]|jgi:ribosomal protein S18 acetylase RimI-like enzyme
MILRKADIDDVPQLIPLMAQLGYPPELEFMQNRFADFVDNDGYGVAVAEQDDKIVGWVAWSKSMLFVLPKVRLRIEGIVVDNKYRRRGVGKKLMRFVEDVAKELSPCVIDLTSGLRRKKDGSHEFYKSLGYANEGYMAKLYLRKEF